MKSLRRVLQGKGDNPQAMGRRWAIIGIACFLVALGCVIASDYTHGFWQHDLLFIGGIFLGVDATAVAVLGSIVHKREHHAGKAIVNELTVSQVNGILFVRKKGWQAGVKALIFMALNHPVAFTLLLYYWPMLKTTPGNLALFFVLVLLPEHRNDK